jgi:D-lactate dehydrogenase (cytochrome)
MVTICLNMLRCAAVLNSDVEADGDLTCQSGARWEDVNQALKDKGIPLFFPVRLLSPIQPYNS